MRKRTLKYPTYAELHELFFYDPDTGFLHWKIRPSSHMMWGDQVAPKPSTDGYLRAGINGVLYKQHNIIWIMKHGNLPDGVTVDHKDKDRRNNRLDNLRLASNRQQEINKNVRGFTKQIDCTLRPWRSFHSIDNQMTRIGNFSTALQARLAYERRTYELEPEFANTWLTDALSELCSTGSPTAWMPGYGSNKKSPSLDKRPGQELFN